MAPDPTPSARAPEAPAGGLDGDDARRLGAGPALALVAGSMLGIGIFIAPPVVAANVARPGQFMLVWLLGGLAALVGALSVAELGAMMPRAGGDYPYLRISYGRGIAFATGWLQLLAVFPGSLATMAAGTAKFQLPVLLGGAYDLPARLGVPVEPAMFWAVAIVVGLTVLNHVGVVISGRAQVALTTIPVVVLLLASLVVLERMGGFRGETTPAPDMPTLTVLHGLALAYLPVYFAYSGWNAAIFIGGEIRDPGRALPRALVGGTLLVIVLYTALCVGFLAVFPLSDLAGVGEAGTAAARRLFGHAGELAVTTLILLAMLGSINGTVLTGSRIAYAMAKHGHCPRPAAGLHPRHKTPVVALWGQAAWTLVLLATQRFEELMNYTSAAMLITGTLTVLAVMVLRRKLPEQPRPYRIPLYPVPPLLYAGSSLAVLALTLAEGDPSVLLGLGYFVAALLVHAAWFRREPAGVAGPVERG